VKITRIDTITSARYPNLFWLHLHTDEGLIGLGETQTGPQTVATYVHESVAPYLLGKDPRAIEAHYRALSTKTINRSMGAETRGLSAVDIALWDLFGQSVGLPIYACMGGPVRDDIRIYNTCAGYGYNVYKGKHIGVSFDESWGVGDHEGPYEDLRKWLNDDNAGSLAQELLDMDITAMKIWPFDQFADETDGQHITPWQIEAGLRPFRQIREAVGMSMEIAVEMHSRWNLQSAIRIVQALEEIRPMWIEDPITMDNPEALSELARYTSTPVTASETLATRFGFRHLLEQGAARIIMLDPGWAGGISESRRIAAMAEAYHRPVAPHDCTGPVVYTAGTHLCLATPNAMIQEGVRAYYGGWYQDVTTNLPVISNGRVRPPDGPGLGISLSDEFLQRDDVAITTSSL
jgi:galactonate dehydratase